MAKHHRQRLNKITYDEIMSFFEWMEFREMIGHRLERCVDFQNRVIMAVRERQNNCRKWSTLPTVHLRLDVF